MSLILVGCPKCYMYTYNNYLEMIGMPEVSGNTFKYICHNKYHGNIYNFIIYYTSKYNKYNCLK